jgi:hypothetical protein
MRFNIFVRFKNDLQQRFCHWPLMLARGTDNDYYWGGIAERWPTEYTDETVGKALAYALANTQVEQVEVKPSEGWMEEQADRRDAEDEAIRDYDAEAEKAEWFHRTYNHS